MVFSQAEYFILLDGRSYYHVGSKLQVCCCLIERWYSNKLQQLH